MFSFNNLFEPKQHHKLEKPKRKIKQKKHREKREISFAFGSSQQHQQQQRAKFHTENYPAPWLKCRPAPTISTNLTILDHEISCLMQYLSPTPHEVSLRKHVVNTYANLITSRFPTSKTLPFGSTGTGLFLPWSDIDLIILDPYPTVKNGNVHHQDPKQNTQASKLSKLFPKLNFANSASSIQLLRKARVPILKMVDSLTRLSVDVCYNVAGGFAAVESVKAWVEKVEGLRELVLLVKLFLSGRELNEVFSGGVGGYSIVVWCLAFLKLRDPETGIIPETASNKTKHSKKRKQSHPNENNQTHSLGSTFLQFCRFFGTQFDYHSQGIGFTVPNTPHDIPQPFLFDKASSQHHQPARPYLFVLLNPLDSSADITRGSTKIQSVAAALAGAAVQLERGLAESSCSNNNNSSTSPAKKKPRKNYYERDFDRGYEPVWDTDEPVSSNGGSGGANHTEISQAESILSNIIFISKHMVRTRDVMAGVSVSLFGKEDRNDGDNEDLVDDASDSDFTFSLTRTVETQSSRKQDFFVSGIMMQDSGGEDDPDDDLNDGSEEGSAIIGLTDEDEQDDGVNGGADLNSKQDDDDDYIAFPKISHINDISDFAEDFTIDRLGANHPISPPPDQPQPQVAIPQNTASPISRRGRVGFNLRAAERRNAKSLPKVDIKKPKPNASVQTHVLHPKHQYQQQQQQQQQKQKQHFHSFINDAFPEKKARQRKPKFNDEYHPSKKSRMIAKELELRNTGTGEIGGRNTRRSNRLKQDFSATRGPQNNREPSLFEREARFPKRRKETVWQDDFIGFREKGNRRVHKRK
ncbi:hypothetical protein BDR26DRAFT_865469, partial [Obelidium mucronatum]